MKKERMNTKKEKEKKKRMIISENTKKKKKGCAHKKRNDKFWKDELAKRKNTKKKKKKDLIKIWTLDGNFIQKPNSPFSLMFFFPEKIKFWWAWKENCWAAPFSLPLSTLNQTHISPPIFSLIFSLSSFHSNQTDA